MSKLQSIRVLAVCESSFIGHYGINEILRPLFTDLAKLKDGYVVSINEQDITLYGGLHLCISDTPAINTLRVFKQGVGFAFDKCRQCQSTMEDLQYKCIDTEFELLTKNVYTQRCDELERANTKKMRQYLSRLYGIN